MVRVACFLIALVFAVPAQAQSTAFCSALRRVYDEAPSDFANVRGGIIGTDSGGGPKYSTSIPVPAESLGVPAVSAGVGCHIIINGENFWQQTCPFSTATDADATRLVDWMVQNIQTCLNTPTLSVDRESNLDVNTVGIQGRLVGFVRLGNRVSLVLWNGPSE